MGRVLVTAALGNVGAELARECAARGLNVRAADLDRLKVEARLRGVEAVRLDFLDRSTWSAALDGCDCVFLF